VWRGLSICSRCTPSVTSLNTCKRTYSGIFSFLNLLSFLSFVLCLCFWMFFTWYGFWWEWNFTYGTPRSQVRLKLSLDLRMTPYLPPWSHAQKYFNKRKLSRCFIIHFDLAFDTVCSMYHILLGFIYLWFRTTVLCFIHLNKKRWLYFYNS
jgi:hypothetical protein